MSLLISTGVEMCIVEGVLGGTPSFLLLVNGMALLKIAQNPQCGLFGSSLIPKPQN